MLLKNIQEKIQRVFPQIKQAEIIKDISDSQEKFADDSEILTSIAQLTDPQSNITWVLPSNLKAIKDVLFYNSSDMPILKSDLDVEYEIVLGKITFVNTDGTQLTRLPTNVSSAYLEYTKYPETIDSISDSLEIPNNLHEGILADLFHKYYSQIPVPVPTRDGVVQMISLNVAKYWEGQYNNYVRKGLDQRYKDRTDYTSTKRDYLGFPKKIPRQKIATTANVQLSSLSSLYSKYIRFTIVSPDTLAISEQFGWDTDIATPTVVSSVVTLASSAEFTDTMTAMPNEKLNHRKVSASSWTFDLPDTFTTILFEVWER